MTAPTPRILIVTDEPVDTLMTAGAIRAWELATVIARQFPVTLAAPVPVPASAPGFTLTPIPPANDGIAALTALVRMHDVVVAQALPLAALPADEMATKYLVVDLYRPWALERSGEAAEASEEGGLTAELATVNGLLAAGDFFLCAGEPQRALWFGALLSLGRLTDRADDARGLIDVVPFGVPGVPPQKRGKVLKGVVPGIEANDFVALWNGGVGTALDPVTLVNATARLRDAGYPIRTVFLNTHRPGAPEPAPFLAARQQSDERELIGQCAFFPEAWVPYAEWADYLLEADVFVSLMQPTLATRFTMRPFVLDALWAGIVPIVGEGDGFADLLRAYDAGRIVTPGDDAALTLTLANMIDNSYERRLLATRGHTLGQSFTWDAAAQPLLAFCRQPVKGTRMPGFTAAELQERVNELERTLFQTSTYAERLERELAARGGPNLAAPPAERGMSALLRRAMSGRRQNRDAADGADATPPPSGSDDTTA